MKKSNVPQPSMSAFTLYVCDAGEVPPCVDADDGSGGGGMTVAFPRSRITTLVAIPCLSKESITLSGVNALVIVIKLIPESSLVECTCAGHCVGACDPLHSKVDASPTVLLPL